VEWENGRTYSVKPITHSWSQPLLDVSSDTTIGGSPLSIFHLKMEADPTSEKLWGFLAQVN